jgi:tripartite-type tricarboxylate transporter receptor subunit TctC
MADWLSRRLGEPVVVENRPGASGNLAVQEVLKAPADGYTLLLLPASAVVNRALYQGLTFDVLAHLEAVSGLVEFTLVMLVNPAVPARTVSELVSYARENPSKLNFASFGIGSTSHLAGELLQAMTGIELTHIPYPGEAAALTDLMAGRVQVMFSVLTTSLPHIRSRTVWPLAVAGQQRSDLLPDVPTISETVAGYEASSWLGVAVKKGTDSDGIAMLRMEIEAGLTDPNVMARFTALAAKPISLSSGQFKEYVVAEADKWGRLVRSLGLTVR